MFKIKCQYREPHPLSIHATIVWLRAAPFYFNARGLLTHRVKSAQSHLRGDGSVRHSSVNYWCGNGCCATNGHFTDLRKENTTWVVVCERCERMAVTAGEPTTDDIAQHHVHIGRAKAIVTCCRK